MRSGYRTTWLLFFLTIVAAPLAYAEPGETEEEATAPRPLDGRDVTAALVKVNQSSTAGMVPPGIGAIALPLAYGVGTMAGLRSGAAVKSVGPTAGPGATPDTGVTAPAPTAGQYASPAAPDPGRAGERADGTSPAASALGPASAGVPQGAGGPPTVLGLPRPDGSSPASGTAPPGLAIDLRAFPTPSEEAVFEKVAREPEAVHVPAAERGGPAAIESPPDAATVGTGSPGGSKSAARDRDVATPAGREEGFSRAILAAQNVVEGITDKAQALEALKELAPYVTREAGASIASLVTGQSVAGEGSSVREESAGGTPGASAVVGSVALDEAGAKADAETGEERPEALSAIPKSVLAPPSAWRGIPVDQRKADALARGLLAIIKDSGRSGHARRKAPQRLASVGTTWAGRLAAAGMAFFGASPDVADEIDTRAMPPGVRAKAGAKSAWLLVLLLLLTALALRRRSRLIAFAASRRASDPRAPRGDRPRAATAAPR